MKNKILLAVVLISLVAVAADWPVPNGNGSDRHTMNELSVTNGISLGGIRITEWPSGGGVSGLNTNQFESASVGNIKSGALLTNINASTFSNTTSYIDVKRDFLAVGDGVADDTAKIQAAINRASVTSNLVFIPAGRYLLTSGLIITNSISIKGESQACSILLVDASFDSNTDIITYQNGKGFSIENITIIPVSGTPGRYGITMDASTNVISYGTLRHLTIEQLGTGSILLITNLFCFVIEENLLVGTICISNAADSIRIDKNSITGKGWGIDGSSIIGARGVNVSRNNITSKGGAIRLINAYSPVIRDNYIEPVSGESVSRLIELGGSNAVYGVGEPLIEGNTLLASLITGVDAIRLDNVNGAMIGRNLIFTAGTGVGIKTTTNTVNAHIDYESIAWAAGVSRLADNSTTTTMLVKSPLNTNDFVGIGSVSIPKQVFHVEATESTNASILIRSSKSDAVGNYSSIIFAPERAFSGDGTSGSIGAAIRAITEATYSTGFKFDTFDQDTGILSEKVRIKANGNAGIGTTNPVEKLQVLGNSSITGTNYVGALHVTNGIVSTNLDARIASATNGVVKTNQILQGSNVTITQNGDNTITIGATAGSVDTNTVIASGYGLGTNTTLHGMISIVNTAAVNEAIFTNGVTIGGERRTTWPSVSTNLYVATDSGIGTNTLLKTPTLTNAVVQGQTDYETYTNSLTSTTNLVLDFSHEVQYVNVNTNVYWINSTNRVAGGTTRFSTVIIANYSGANLTMSLASLSANWIGLGTIPTVLTNNRVLVFSAANWGPSETNITFAASN